MSIANAHYEFLYCDVRRNVRNWDGFIENTKFYEKLLHQELSLPLRRKPDSSTIDLPFVYVGDEAFALRKDLLKPLFTQKDQIFVTKYVLIFTLCLVLSIVEFKCAKGC